MAQRARCYGAIAEDHCRLDAVAESETDRLREETAGRQSLLARVLQTGEDHEPDGATLRGEGG